MVEFEDETDQIRNMVSALSLQAQAQSGRQSAAGGNRSRNTAFNDNLPATSPSSVSMSSGLMASQTSPTPSRRTVSFSTASASPIPDFTYPSPSSPRQRTRFVDEHIVIISDNLPAAEKDVDDPNSPEVAISSNDRREYSTNLLLSRLFASEASTIPSQSGALSYQPNLQRRKRYFKQSW